MEITIFENPVLAECLYDLKILIRSFLKKQSAIVLLFCFCGF